MPNETQERPRKPFQGHESRAYALVGDIMASCAACYKNAGYAIKRLERMRELGYFKREVEADREQAKAERDYVKAMRKYRQDLEIYEETMKEHRLISASHKLKMAHYYTAMKTWVRRGKAGPEPKRPPQPNLPKVDRPIPPTAPVSVKQDKGRPSFKNMMEAKRSAMKRERAFILSDTFTVFLGNSEHTPESILFELDRVIDEYDPTPHVPEIDPNTHKPYPIERWQRILKERNEANGKKMPKPKPASTRSQRHHG